MYCINCGVKLEDTEKRCPLCGVAVYHPEISRPEAVPLYPPHRYPVPEAASKAAQIVITTLMAIAALTNLFIDRQINGSVSWGGIAAGGIWVAYVLVVFPFWFKKWNPSVYLGALFGSIALYLGYICRITGGSWFWSFALPVTAYIGILIYVQSILLHRWQKKAMVILGGGFFDLGLLMPLMEYLIEITFHPDGYPAWSVYPMIGLFLLGGMLIFLSVNRRAREKMEEKFFI